MAVLDMVLMPACFADADAKAYLYIIGIIDQTSKPPLLRPTIQRSSKNQGSASKITFVPHLANDHKFLILHAGDNSVIKAVSTNNKYKLSQLLPYIPLSVKAMSDMEIEHLYPQFNGCYAQQNYDTLCMKAKKGYKSVMHSKKALPALQSKKRMEYKQGYKEFLDEEVAKAMCVENNGKNMEHCYVWNASMNVEEKMAKGSKDAAKAREQPERVKDDLDFKEEEEQG